MGEGERKREKKKAEHLMLISLGILYGDWSGFYSRSQSFQNKGGSVETLSIDWLGDGVARKEFKLGVSGIIFLRRAMRVTEMTHGLGREAVQPPLPFTLSLLVGGCGHRAQGEAAASGGGE